MSSLCRASVAPAISATTRNRITTTTTTTTAITTTTNIISRSGRRGSAGAIAIATSRGAICTCGRDPVIAIAAPTLTTSTYLSLLL